MVFITSMITVVIVNIWQDNGIVVSFLIAIVMELINVLLTTSGVKKIEDSLEDKYKQTIEDLKKTIEENFKKAEMYREEMDKWKKLFEGKPKSTAAE
ncbi:MAG: hypothetical protein HQK79_07290 [Desulfobacterales bacterium]|nr:hypothetical protein [Desulfobacterales bacterium]MBF0396425.1 hypothetical protein [Desulfobacterales bacterium]